MWQERIKVCKEGQKIMTIPLVNLIAQYHQIKSEVKQVINKVMETAAFIGGEQIEKFEEDFAQLHDAKYCVATSSGTAALHLALWCVGVNEHQVIVPVNTFIATAEAVKLVGGDVVFADCDMKSYNIEVIGVNNILTEFRSSNETVKAIIPVHLYGQSANLMPIMQLAQEYDLFIIEDCAQAHLAEYNGQRVGTFGDIGCFSFYPSKNLGAYGDAGALITNKKEFYEAAKIMQNHGRSKHNEHTCAGHNYRMDAIQAAILNIKLKYLEEWTEKRRENAQLYQEELSDITQISCPKEMPWGKHVYHLFVIRTERRDELRNYLDTYGIATGIHYPVPLHLQPAFAALGYEEGEFPIAEKYAKEILSLPIYPELTKEQIQYITHHIRTFYRI